MTIQRMDNVLIVVEDLGMAVGWQHQDLARPERGPLLDDPDRDAGVPAEDLGEVALAPWIEVLRQDHGHRQRTGQCPDQHAQGIDAAGRRADYDQLPSVVQHLVSLLAFEVDARGVPPRLAIHAHNGVEDTRVDGRGRRMVEINAPVTVHMLALAYRLRVPLA